MTTRETTSGISLKKAFLSYYEKKVSTIPPMSTKKRVGLVQSLPHHRLIENINLVSP